VLCGESSDDDDAVVVVVVGVVNLVDAISCVCVCVNEKSVYYMEIH